MANSLVIVESPAKARTIASILGPGFTVESSVGHVRDLPGSAREIPKAYKGEPWANLAVDVDNDFKPLYIIPARKRDQVKKLRSLLKNADEVYLATDEDREGESIAWHLLEVLNPKVPVKRMVFHEITKPAIQQAMENTRDLDRKLVDAQEARRILDRLYGWELSEVLWKKIMPKLSAGRVQSVATRLVVERERDRIAFRAGAYWSIDATLDASGEAFAAGLHSVDGVRVATGKDFDPDTGRIAGGKNVLLLDGLRAEAIRARLEGSSPKVVSVEAKDYQNKPYAPFITSTLQQEAGRKLRFSASRAMSVAQRLYERGYITYMRTDSTTLSEQALAAARSEIERRYGREYLPAEPRLYTKKVKGAQEAHEAIRPAGETFRSVEDVASELDDDERKLYDLIWKRTVASQMENARGKRMTVQLSADGPDGEALILQANGRVIVFPGYLRAYVEGSDDPEAELDDREVVLPQVEENQLVACTSAEAKDHETKPPARYTEARLVQELEARGIGRPSTYASVIQTIQDRGYVWKKGTALVPSWTAFAVVQLLETHFGDLIDYDFTANMESDLDAIAHGGNEAVPWLTDFYFGGSGDHAYGLHKQIETQFPDINARAINSITVGQTEGDDGVVVRVGRYGPYVDMGEKRASVPTDLAPDELTTELALELIERQNAPDRVLGTDPETGKEIVVKDGRYGPYVQLGQPEPPPAGKKRGAKPKTSSLFKTMDPRSVTLDEALDLLSIPRSLGEIEGEEVVAYNGRFGPYLKRGDDSRSLQDEGELLTVTLEQAVDLFSQPKRRGRRQQRVLRELGENKENGTTLKILDGRYGPYVTDGTTNASIPRGREPETVKVEEAVEWLRARADAKR